MLTRSRSRSHSSEGTAAGDGSQSSYSQSDSAPKEELKVKRKKIAKPRGRGFKRKPAQWVCVMPKTFQTSQENATTISLVTLKHPGSS